MAHSNTLASARVLLLNTNGTTSSGLDVWLKKEDWATAVILEVGVRTRPRLEGHYYDRLYLSKNLTVTDARIEHHVPPRREEDRDRRLPEHSAIRADITAPKAELR